MKKVDYDKVIQSKIEELEGCVVRDENGMPELHLIQDADLRAFAEHFTEFGRRVERTIIGAQIKEAGNRQELGWISVKDRLPGPSEWVVVCIKDHGIPQCIALATYNEQLGKWFADDWEDEEQVEYNNPDYWLPIPQFRKEEQ